MPVLSKYLTRHHVYGIEHISMSQ
uniref:Uncharacterized protein n=2 Tax=Anguilla anguilla TaxID=7936 RepID=A0A0E9UBN8_ANGAN